MRLFLPVVVGLALASTPLAQNTMRLTTGSGAGERQPVVCADGTVVAYTAMANGVREVFTVPIDGGAAVPRTVGAAVRVGWSVFDTWPALSISDDGTRVAYWNAQGVHVLDIAAATDAVLASAAVLPYPQISGDGARVVYQASVGTDLEVFVVDVAAAVPQQITFGSGAGRRLPHVRGDKVVFQRAVGGQQEVFVHDLGTSQTSGPLTTNSGLGNRYARLSHDGGRVAYEVVAGGRSQALALDLSGGVPQALGAPSSGDRVCWPTQDAETILQARVENLEVYVANPVLRAITSGTRAGLRRASTDHHGTVVVYQADEGNAVEVFCHRLCYPVGVSTYGVHGQPSQGSLAEFDRRYRCTATIGLTTGFAPGTSAVLFVGTQTAVPLAGAPGNTLYVQPQATLPVAVDPSGALQFTFAAPTVLFARSVFAQWLIADPPLNAWQLVASKGVRLDLQ